MELDQWLCEHPPEARGLKAHAPDLQRLKALGYTQQQMSAWLATQGLAVSRQAVSKFFLRACATSAQPDAPRRNTSATAGTPEATTQQQPCNSQTNPNAAPPTEPGATLKARAQAVGDRYLQQTTSPLAAALLIARPPRNT